MKQLLIISGKGGTGKTTIAAAFIKLANIKASADCDVDAPNLHLVSSWKSPAAKRDFFGLDKAEIDQDICIECGLCKENCRFDAITDNDGYKVDHFACEGCGVCEFVCPVSAIKLNPSIAGELDLYAERGKVFSTAQLKMGSGNSGLLVTDVKKQMKNAAVDTDLAIIDGSPGIGCPVIASISGVDMALVVAEPSVSGISDMQRIVSTAEKFEVTTAVCINKYDTNTLNTEKIEQFCKANNLPLIGKIPFDFKAITATNNGQTIVDIDCESGKAAAECYAEVIKLLF